MTTVSPEGSAPTRVRRPPRRAEVRGRTQLTPQRVLLTFGGPDLEGYALRGPTGHFKLFFPPADEDELDIQPGPNRSPSAAVARTFTPRRFDNDRLELEAEFYVHGDGPASTFANRAQPGDPVAIGEARAPYALQPDRRQLLVGDETAIPAIDMILEALPPSANGLVVLELGDPRDAPEFQAPKGVDIRIVARDGVQAGNPMVDAIEENVTDGSEIQAWVAGEASAIRRARTVLSELGVPREQLTTRGYWRHGEVAHTDRDMGDD